ALSFGAVLADEITALVTGVNTDKMEITYKEVTNPGKDQTVGEKELTIKYAKELKVTSGGGGGRGGKGGKGGKGGAAQPETGGVSLLQDKLAKAKDAGKAGVTATLVRDEKSKTVTEATIRGGRGGRGGGGDQ